MKTTTWLAIGAGAGVLLYLKGKSAVQDVCVNALQASVVAGHVGSLPPAVQALVSTAAGLAPADLKKMSADYCAQQMDQKMSTVGYVRAGLVSLWRPLEPGDIQ